MRMVLTQKTNMGIQANVENAWEFPLTENRCSECKELIKGTLFIDKESLTVVDSLGFMLFSGQMVCDRCLSEMEEIFLKNY